VIFSTYCSAAGAGGRLEWRVEQQHRAAKNYCLGSELSRKTTGLSASGQQTRAIGSSLQGNRPLKRSVVINGNIELNAHAHMPSGQVPSETTQVRPTWNPEGHFPPPMISTISTRTSVPILSTPLPPRCASFCTIIVRWTHADYCFPVRIKCLGLL
jgi:hypothetical protein